MTSKLESFYRLVVFVVFLLTAWFAIPGTFWPHAVLDVLGVAVPQELIWAGFAFQLVFLVSMFALPVLIDWRRYRFNAIVFGLLHLALAAYWLVIYPWQTGLRAYGLGWCEMVLAVMLLGLLQLIWHPVHAPAQVRPSLG